MVREQRRQQPHHPVVLGVVMGVILAGVVIGVITVLGQPTPLQIATQAVPAPAVVDATAFPTATPSATPTAQPTALPAGYGSLGEAVATASFAVRPDPGQPATALHLAVGTPLKATGERQGPRCRASIADGTNPEDKRPHIWLDCTALEVTP